MLLGSSCLHKYLCRYFCLCSYFSATHVTEGEEVVVLWYLVFGISIKSGDSEKTHFKKNVQNQSSRG